MLQDLQHVLDFLDPASGCLSGSFRESLIPAGNIVHCLDVGNPQHILQYQLYRQFQLRLEMPSVNKGLPQRTYLKKACEPSTTSEAKSKYSEG